MISNNCNKFSVYESITDNQFLHFQKEIIPV